MQSIPSESIEFSLKQICFTKNNKNICILKITNRSSHEHFLFKLKTTSLNTYEVKPPMGILKPNDSKNIEFKLIVPVSQQQISKIRSKDKFQLQLVAVQGQNVPKSKAYFHQTWDKMKQDPVKKESLYHINFPIVIGEPNMEIPTNQEPSTPIKLKSGLSKLEKKSSIKKQSVLKSNLKSEGQLSRQFDILKQKEEKLLEEREIIFKSQTKFTDGQTSKGKGGQMALLILAFLLSVLIGNFLKLRVFVDEDI